jgi:glycosyltransferase involved in cell wall biosynthesis
MHDLSPDVRIALVHEWFVVPAGSEQVLQQIKAIFPQADVFCLVDKLKDEDRRTLGVAHPRTSFLQHIPGVERHYRWLLPIMPMAVERLDLRAYDLVISNSHAVAKGVRVRDDALHLCHCNSPMRYAWDLRSQYLQEAGLDRGMKGWLAGKMLDRLQRWDAATSRRVDRFVANSNFIADRIRRCYDRTSAIIYPPVDTDYYTPGDARSETYVAASRMVSYKRIPAIVEAFRALPDRKLIVIGDGPDREKVAAVAGANVTLMGWQPREVLRAKLREARAFIFAAEEDFGILPVEAQACGAPVVAFGAGGALETVVSEGAGRTGAFFAEPTAAGIARAIREFEAGPLPSAATCRANAERFSVERFRRQFQEFVLRAWNEHKSGAAI